MPEGLGLMSHHFFASHRIAPRFELDVSGPPAGWSDISPFVSFRVVRWLVREHLRITNSPPWTALLPTNVHAPLHEANSSNMLLMWHQRHWNASGKAREHCRSLREFGLSVPKGAWVSCRSLSEAASLLQLGGSLQIFMLLFKEREPRVQAREEAKDPMGVQLSKT